jgi:hypothetical protein
VHGSGNGIMCALGRGYDTLQAAKSDNVSKLIEVAIAADQIEFSDRLIRSIFDRKTARGVYELALLSSSDGMPNAATFDQWRGSHAELIERTLNPPAPTK